MKKYLFIIVWSVLALSGCGYREPKVTTGNELVDLVVGYEAPSNRCVAIGGKTRIYEYGKDTPPARIMTDTFDREDIRQAAVTIAGRNFEPEDDESFQTYGTVEYDRCLMSVSQPVIERDLAFVTFSHPGGRIGAYAFERSDSGWVVAEKEWLGFW